MKKRLSPDTLKRIRCPICRSSTRVDAESIACLGQNCSATFPIIEGIPVLINEQQSLFSIADFINHKPTYFRPVSKNPIKAFWRKIVPDISRNIRARKNFALLADLLLRLSPAPKVLIIGGSIIGEGISNFLSRPNFDLLETDISLGERTQIICDAHDLPFADGTFDAVIVQAVLEHVINPQRCVEEISRVLSNEGYVYAETPFMQQVHGGKYDFHRFTYLGHRVLFRHFSEIESGIVSGPGMALAWSYQYFLQSFTSIPIIRRLFHDLSCFTSFYLKYFDTWLSKNVSAFDAASGYYFLGRKDSRLLSDKELLNSYKGAFRD